MSNKEMKIEFAPGCFDNFEGTQEELDSLLIEIHRLVETGELFENSQPLDIDEMSEEEMIGLANALGINLDDDQDTTTRRNLQ